MHLKRLELCGFKTFPDRTVLEFTESTGISAIVGPNGCGKSNLIDAFRWVMGEQSIKLLRGSTQEEVVFNGTDDRKALSMAEVTLTIDNSDRKLSIDYAEVQIGRRYYRSGESEYLINKQVVRLKDVQELLMDTGIGKGSYAIIGQGQVQELIHSKPEDRRTFFEEAAGINKYKSRKIVAQRKLAVADQNLIRLRDIRSEIHQQLGPLEEQARIAKEYQILKKDLAKLEIGLFKVKVGKINDLKIEVEKAISEYRKIVNEADTSAAEIAEKKQSFRDKILEIEAKLSTLSANQAQLRQQKEDVQNRVNVSHERISNQAQRLLALEQEIAQLIQAKANLELKESETLAELAGSEKAVLEYQEKLNRRNEETKGIFERWQYISLEIEELKAALNKHNNEIEIKRSKMMGLESSERVINSDIQRIIQSLATVEQERSELTRKDTELTTRKQYVETKIGELRQKRDELFKQKSDKEEEKKQLLAQRGETKEKFDTSSSRLKLLKEMQDSHEGYQKGVRSVFQAKKENVGGFAGVRGVLADIITVPKQYEAAIEAALENNVQAIVAENDAAVTQAINYLKERTLGRATFLPSASLAGKNATASKGVIASTVVTFAEEHRGLIQALLGSVVIVDALQDALQMRSGLANSGLRAAVTIAGEIVTSEGAVTGGSASKEAVSLLGRQREIIELQKDIEQYRDSLNELDKQNKEIDQLFVTIENELKSHGNELKSLEIEQGTVTNDLARITIDRGKLDRQFQTNTQDQAEFARELEKISNEKLNVNNQLAELNTQKDSQVAVIASKEQELTAASQEKEKVNEILTEIRISSTNAEGTKRQIELKLESFRESYKHTVYQVEQKNKEKETLVAEKEKVQIATDMAKEELPQLEAELASIEEQIKADTTERSRFFNDLDVYDRMERERADSDREVRSRLSEEEVKMARIDAEYNEMNRRLSMEYDLTIEDVLKSDAVVEDYEKTADEVEKLKRRIKRMEPVNLLAIEEYEAQKERLAFIETQCEDLDKSKADLQKIILELDQTAILAFRETFDSVNVHFQRVFTELFKGGSAELKLMDEVNVLESGVEIYAKVPGTKRAQSMTLLSGGQKSLTALALLFALLSARPGPFCILDEIDAELDDINIGRVTDILQQYSQETQIIIITHRQPTMAIVSTMFGLTMEQKGISKVVSLKMAGQKTAEAVIA